MVELLLQLCRGCKVCGGRQGSDAVVVFTARRWRSKMVGNGGGCRGEDWRWWCYCSMNEEVRWCWWWLPWLVRRCHGGCRQWWVMVAARVWGKLGFLFWRWRWWCGSLPLDNWLVQGLLPHGLFWLANFKRWRLPHGMIWSSGV